MSASDEIYDKVAQVLVESLNVDEGIGNSSHDPQFPSEP
jgi:hypothetical protein